MRNKTKSAYRPNRVNLFKAEDMRLWLNTRVTPREEPVLVVLELERLAPRTRTNWKIVETRTLRVHQNRVEIVN